MDNKAAIRTLAFLEIGMGLALLICSLIITPAFMTHRIIPAKYISYITTDELIRFRVFITLLGVFSLVAGTVLIRFPAASISYYKFFAEKIKRIPPWIILLTLAVLFFPLKGVNTSSDSAWYLTQGLNIYKGLGYADASLSPVLSRGPVFPALIAVSFWLFGVSVQHAFWVVRLFYVFNVLVICAIGNKLYGKWVGFVASLLVLTSATVNRWSSLLLLDNVVPCFILVSILCVYIAFDKKSYIWFMVSGIILGIAYLTKEISLIFFPLPLVALIFIKDFRKKRNLAGILFFTLSLLIVIGLWMAHVYKSTGGPSLFLGNTGPRVIQVLASPKETAEGPMNISTVQKYAGWFLNYYNQYVIRKFVLGPFFVFAWLFLLVRGIIKKHKQHLFLFLSILLFFPVMFFQGEEGQRAGNSMILYLLTCIAFSSFLLVVSRYVFAKTGRLLRGGYMPQEKLKRMRYISAGIGLLMAAICILDFFIKAINIRSLRPFIGGIGIAFIVFPIISLLKKEVLYSIVRYGVTSFIGLVMLFQIIGERMMVALWLGMTPYGMSYYISDNFEISGWHSRPVEEAGTWISKNLSKDSKFMCDWYWLDSIYFFSGGGYQFFEVPYLVFPKRVAPSRQMGISSIENEKPLFLWAHKKSSYKDRSDMYGYLRALREGDLFSEIRQRDITYIITTPRRRFLSLYFEKNPSFEEVTQLDNGQIKIYKVIKAEPSPNSPLYIGDNVRNYLNYVKKTDLAVYSTVKNNFLNKMLNLDDAIIERIERGDSPDGTSSIVIVDVFPFQDGAVEGDEEL